MRVRRGLLLFAVAVIGVTGVSAGMFSARAAHSELSVRPNIVFVLTDDLSWNLVRYMPHVLQLQRDGVTFGRYFVTDSLCCPSRTSIFTGLFPHDSGVYANRGRQGGFAAFQAHGDEAKTFAVALHAHGYLTAMMGKYLNGYEPRTLTLPTGWDDWHVAGNGYPEFDYNLNENGQLVHYGGPVDPSNYLTDVLATAATNFIDQAAAAHKPFLLEVATFAPHAPYTPAPRNAYDFPGLKEPRDPSFNANNVHPPSWLGTRAPLSRGQIGRIDIDYRKRAQAVQAVDRLIGEVEAVLESHGLEGDTYVVFSSDNGYHMGQHRLRPGKLTAFDTDIRVPLVVAGPSVPHGRTINQIAENIDLYPTFVQLTGGRPHARVDGRSLLRLLHGQTVPDWRTIALVEHRGPIEQPGDPDFENGELGGNPTSYEAVRLGDAVIAGHHIRDAVYVEYTNGEREYYDIKHDPYEHANIYDRLHRQQRAQLHAIVAALKHCHGSAPCWRAARPRSLPGDVPTLASSGAHSH
jgi:N-acetylglucosamine-6-sulfatase